MLSTANGNLYFAALTAPENSEADMSYRMTIRGWMANLAQKYKLKEFDYKPVVGRINLKGLNIEQESLEVGPTIRPAS